MSRLSLDDAKDAIDAIFAGYQAVAGSSVTSVLPGSLTAGKVYESWILAEVVQRLVTERYRPSLMNSSKARLRSAPGPIDRSFAHFRLEGADDELEIWTDIEFLTLSRSRSGRPSGRGDYHELDVMVVEAGVIGRPSHDRVVIGVECKDTPYTKALLRAILGVRRELSYLTGPQGTRFRYWPANRVPADPPSCLVTYCSHQEIALYAGPGEFFGIRFEHLDAP